MKKLLLITALLSAFQSKNFLKCLLENLYNEINIHPDALEQIQKYFQERDFDVKVDVKNMNKFNMLNHIDFSTKNQLEEILLNFDNLPDITKQAILSCSVDVSNVKKRCEEVFPRGCEQVSQFAYAPACPKGYSSSGITLCVPNCPDDFKQNPNAPLSCEKDVKASRASKLSHFFKLPKTSFRNMVSLQCPESWTSLEYDLCIKECPEGWEDKGRVCEKPLIQRRGHEIFVYLFNYDNRDD